MQIFERGPSRSALQSQLLGQGIGEVGGRMAGQQYRRGQLASAFEKVRSEAGQEGASPLGNLLNTLQAFSHIPNSEKYVGQILPTLMQALTAEQYQTGRSPYGQQPSEGMSSQQQPIKEITPEDVMTKGGAGLAKSVEQSQNPYTPPIGLFTEPSQKAPEGIIPPILTPQEMDRKAREAVERTGNPAMYQQTLSDLNSLNQLSQAKIGEVENRLVQSGIPKENIQEAMQLGQEFSNVRDLNQYTGLVKQKYDQFRNFQKSLSTVTTPGFWRGLLSSAKDREESLSRLNGPIREAIDAGLEQQVRKDLTNLGLSPTEIEERIHPLDKQTQHSINSFPVYKTEMEFTSGIPQRKVNAPNSVIEKQLEKFFKNNIKPGNSLLVMRHKLWQDHGVPWELIEKTANKVIEDNKIKLSNDQRNELGELGQPPRQDLSSIFQDWWRIIEFGKKAK